MTGTRSWVLVGGAVLVLSWVGCTAAAHDPRPHATRTEAAKDGARPGLDHIEHIVVIYAENRSFDNLYGSFPGANGLANATNATQVDRDGKPLPFLPRVLKKDKTPDPAFPENLKNEPFAIDREPINLPLSKPTRDLVHKFYQNQEQIDGGKNDRFAIVSDGGGLVMGHYDGSQLPMWAWAKRYTLADNFFQGAFGGSFLNHQWLVCACTPTFPDAPQGLRAELDDKGRLRKDNSVTPDGFAVNTLQPPYEPSGIPPAAAKDPRFSDPAQHPLPPQKSETIGDRLSEKGIDWAWYAGAWNDAIEDGTQSPNAKRDVIYNETAGSPNFQPHHQPFNYFEKFAPGTPERERHLKDYRDFVDAIDQGTLPAVAFYKPQGSLNEHPGYTDVLSGDRHVAEIVAKLAASPQWSTMAIIVTYDENGGWWDHVAPPAGDQWGPGSRIPAIVISPFAKPATVDHTLYDTTSILKLITRRFHLDPLPGVRAQVGDMTNAFVFGPS